MNWLAAAPLHVVVSGHLSTGGGTNDATWLALGLSLLSVLVAAYSVWQTNSREHFRWLQEKRREAYVTFMTSTRDAYEAIAERGRLVDAPRVPSDYDPILEPYEGLSPEAARKDLEKRGHEIDVLMGQVKRAQDVLTIVGPKDMATLGGKVHARLKLDRGYYSPTGYTHRELDEDRILENARETGDGFLTALRRAYAGDEFSLEKYREAFHRNPLSDLWDKFTLAARQEMDRTTPKRERST